MSDSITPRVTSVMLDCNDLDAVIGFWTGFLGLTVRNRFEQYAWLSKVGDPEKGLNLAFQVVPETKTVKNRMHLDMATTDLAAVRGRVIELGGSVVADIEHGNFTWTVFADPEGNEFCVAVHH